MKPKSGLIVSLIFLFFAMCLALTNIFSGFELSNNHQADPENHLLRAISVLVLGILGSVLSIFFSHRWMEKILRDKALRNERLSSKKSKSQSAAGMSALIVILLCVLSLISGTISHAGRFPILHSVLGFALCGTLIVSLILWLQSFFEILNLTKSDESSAAA